MRFLGGGLGKLGKEMGEKISRADKSPLCTFAYLFKPPQNIHTPGNTFIPFKVFTHLSLFLHYDLEQFVCSFEFLRSLLCMTDWKIYI